MEVAHRGPEGDCKGPPGIEVVGTQEKGLRNGKLQRCTKTPHAEGGGAWAREGAREGVYTHRSVQERDLSTS